jgi:hypothetical protein
VLFDNNNEVIENCTFCCDFFLQLLTNHAKKKADQRKWEMAKKTSRKLCQSSLHEVFSFHANWYCIHNVYNQSQLRNLQFAAFQTLLQWCFKLPTFGLQHAKIKRTYFLFYFFYSIPRKRRARMLQWMSRMLSINGKLNAIINLTIMERFCHKNAYN